VSPDAFTLDARFLSGRLGALFTVERYPANDIAPTASALVVPPFAEEMNRSRRFITALSERLALAGLHVNVLDPFGTGDSAGMFAEATWSGWVEDVRTGCAVLAREHTTPPWIIGIRTGALLALEAALTEATDSVAGLVFLQPVTNGRRFLQQFLRTRIAANMRLGRSETTTELMQRLEAGECIDVAGYTLPGDVALPLAGGRMEESVPPPCPLLWYELQQSAETATPRRLTPPESWNPVIAVDRAVAGDPFWQIEEPPAVPTALIDAVVKDLTERLT